MRRRTTGSVRFKNFKRFDEALSEIDLEMGLVPENKAGADAKARIPAAKAASSR